MVKNYKEFISSCKTERECVKYVENALIRHDFSPLDKVLKVAIGSKVYFNQMGKSIIAFRLGKESLDNGMKILCAHLDSPRIDIKVNPVYSDNGLVYLDTHYYGGIRKYQWVTTPLAIHGVICKKDGKKINVEIGEDENDPIFYISDLLPHLADEQNKRVLKLDKNANLNEMDMYDKIDILKANKILNNNEPTISLEEALKELNIGGDVN